MKPATAERDASLYAYLVRDHEALDELYGRVLAAMEANDAQLDSLWSEFDDHLRAHMEAEERFIIPAFANVDRVEALALVREHGQIREEMLELGVACNLHELRYQRARDLVDQLRSHAARENNLLYRWADTHLDTSDLTAALRRR